MNSFSQLISTLHRLTIFASEKNLIWEIQLMHEALVCLAEKNLVSCWIHLKIIPSCLKSV